MLLLSTHIKRFCRLTFGLSALAVAVTGCDSTLAAEDYDQRCNVAADCTTVLVGDMCECGCDMGAIATSALPEFRADDADARDACVFTVMCDACWDTSSATCVSGKCTLVK